MSVRLLRAWLRVLVCSSSGGPFWLRVVTVGVITDMQHTVLCVIRLLPLSELQYMLVQLRKQLCSQYEFSGVNMHASCFAAVRTLLSFVASSFAVADVWLHVDTIPSCVCYARYSWASPWEWDTNKSVVRHWCWAFKQWNLFYLGCCCPTIWLNLFS